MVPRVSSAASCAQQSLHAPDSRRRREALPSPLETPPLQAPPPPPPGPPPSAVQCPDMNALHNALLQAASAIVAVQELFLSMFFFHLGGGGAVAFCWLARSPRTSWGNGGLPRPCWGQAVGLQRAMFRVISGAGCLVHAKSGAIWCGPPLRETIVFSQLTGRPAQTLREPLVAAAQRAIHGLQAIEASRGRSSAVARGDARPWEVIAPAFPRPCP